MGNYQTPNPVMSLKTELGNFLWEILRCEYGIDHFRLAFQMQLQAY